MNSPKGVQKNAHGQDEYRDSAFSTKSPKPDPDQEASHPKHGQGNTRQEKIPDESVEVPPVSRDFPGHEYLHSEVGDLRQD